MKILTGLKIAWNDHFVKALVAVFIALIIAIPLGTLIFIAGHLI